MGFIAHAKLEGTNCPSTYLSVEWSNQSRLSFLFLTMSVSLATNDNARSTIKELCGTCEPSGCTLLLSTVNPNPNPTS